MSYSRPGPFHRAKYIHLAQESEKLKEDLGEGGASTGLVADLCQRDDPADE